MPRRITSGEHDGDTHALIRAWRQSGLPLALSKLAPFGVQVAVSAVAYSAGLGVAQVVGATLRVSCNTNVLSSALGCLGVGTASAFAGHMGRHAKRQLESGKPLLEMLKAPFWDDVQLEEVALDAFCGVLAFKAWGGSFRQVMPSDLRYPGAFGYQSLPTSAADYSSSGEKRQLIMIFKRDGCHHCGTRKGAVIGDHMPPTKLFKEAAVANASNKMIELWNKARNVMHLGKAPGGTQRYFAQCTPCSIKQGVVLRHGRRSPIVLHRWIVPPGTAPGVIVGLRAYVSTPYALPPSGGGGKRGGGGGGGSGGQVAWWGWPGRNNNSSNSHNNNNIRNNNDTSLFHTQLQLMAAESPITPSPPRNMQERPGNSCTVVPLTLDESEMGDEGLAVAPLS